MSSGQFVRLNTGNQILDRIQGNIASAFNSTGNSGVVTVKSNNFVVPADAQFVMIPTASIMNGAVVLIGLPDATKNAGVSFYWKKTDSSSNTVTFYTTTNSASGNPQTIENASTYSTSSALASGFIFCDGIAWWIG
jgi:hypothetical protein